MPLSFASLGVVLRCGKYHHPCMNVARQLASLSAVRALRTGVSARGVDGSELAPMIARDRPRSGVLAVAGIAMLLAGLGYLIIEVVAASAWAAPPYHWAANFVSDLGDPACGPYDGRIVCSPLNRLMNLGFVAEGVLFGFAGILMSQALVARARVAMLVSGRIVHVANRGARCIPPGENGNARRSACDVVGSRA